MSIRLRLTILYSSILAITLIAFSAILYVTQAQVTLNNVKASLIRQAAPFADGPRGVFGEHPNQPPSNTNHSLPPLPGRWTQIRDAYGNVVVMTSDLSESPLPLSEQGLASVKTGVIWFEPAVVDEEPLLILSNPVMSEGQIIQIIQVATPTAERAQSLDTLRWTLTIGSIIVTLAALR
jgi:hypothetical protein